MSGRGYQNALKHVSPPFNPGVRTWAGVTPEKQIVDLSYRPFYSF